MNKNAQTDYEQWIKFRIKKNLAPLTRTQSHFAKFCFEHKEVLAQIGNLDAMFSEVRHFIKNDLKDE